MFKHETTSVTKKAIESDKKKKRQQKRMNAEKSSDNSHTQQATAKPGHTEADGAVGAA